MIREGSWFWFRNPSGSLDTEPGLYHLYSLFLRVLYPLWSSYSYIFDHVLGLIYSFFIFRELRLLTDAQVPKLWMPMFFVGGSLGFLLSFYSRESMLLSVQFGNQPLIFLAQATQSLLYQFLFLRALRTACSGALAQSAALTLLLSILHPIFYALGFLSCAVAGAARYWREPNQRRALVRPALLLTLSVVYVLGVTGYLVPKFSEDAARIRDGWSQSFYSIPWHAFILPSGLLFLGLLVHCLFTKKFRYLFQTRSLPKVAVLSFLFLVTLAPTFGVNIVPQSGRWISASFYWVSLVLLLGYLNFEKVNPNKWLQRIVLSLFLVDGLLIAWTYTGMAAIEKRDHYLVSTEQKEVLDHLRSKPAGLFVWIRGCGRENLWPGDFEYLLMTETQHWALISQYWFTPRIQEASLVLSGCSAPPVSHGQKVAIQMAHYLLIHRANIWRAEGESFKDSGILKNSDLVLLERSR